MSTSTRQRQAVLIGIIVSWGLSGGYIWLGWHLAQRYALFSGWQPMQSAAFAALLAAATLIAGIGWAARTRQFKQNIEGTAPPEGSALDITLRYVTNTTEQLLIFAITLACAAQIAPQISVVLLPVMGSWFVLARAQFYVGYRINPLARSVGFAGTFHPTIALFVFVIWRLFQ